MSKAPPKWFTLSLPDDMARKMNRAQYYQMRSLMRQVDWLVAAELQANQVEFKRAFVELMTTGQTKLNNPHRVL